MYSHWQPIFLASLAEQGIYKDQMYAPRGGVAALQNNAT